MNTQEKATQVHQFIEFHREEIINFMREICAIPSMDSQIEAVGKRIGSIHLSIW